MAHYGPPAFDLTLRSINLACHIGVEATPEMVHTLETVVQSTMEEPEPSLSIKHPCLKECITSVCDEDTSVNWQEAVQGWTALDSPTVPQLGPGWTMLDNSHIIMDCCEELSSTVQYSSIWQASFNFNQLYHYH